MFRQGSFGKAISFLILFLRNLDELGLQLTYSSPHLLQILLHLFPFAFKITIHLTGDHLGVTIHNHTCYPRDFSKIQSYY